MAFQPPAPTREQQAKLAETYKQANKLPRFDGTVNNVPLISQQLIDNIRTRQANSPSYLHFVQGYVCPLNIPTDLGMAFGMGYLGGYIWFGSKGLRNAPRGYRLASAKIMGKNKATMLAGSFALWGGSFSVFHCLFSAYRHHEGWTNSVFAGGATGFMVSNRKSLFGRFRSGVIGAALLGMIEFVGMGLMSMSQYQPMPQSQHAPPNIPLTATAS